MSTLRTWARHALFIGAFALACFELCALSVSTEELIPSLSNGELRVTTPRLHFLSGRSLQRLRDGVAVPFDFQLSLASGNRANITQRALERFIISYDLWEQKFSVMRMSTRERSSTRLDPKAAEAWCIHQLSIKITGPPSSNPAFWARLEVRSVVDQRPPMNDSGISLTGLIDVFSRPVRAQQDHWALESGAFHLAELQDRRNTSLE